ncbi:MAG: acyl--CoA ligase [Propionibacteriaceae bacterium]|jgi:acyl-coenzyme A synthetase/AMP-(fatty) acid ligase|nr:acyl--CoA ligase [Propionibacteriaceae bacterium]
MSDHDPITDYVPGESIASFWIRQNAIRPDAPATEYFGNVTTFSALSERIDRYARAFKALKRDPEGTMTLCMPILPTTLALYFALNKIGERPSFMSEVLLEHEGLRYLTQTNTETLVVLDYFFPPMAEAVAASGVANVVLVSLADDLVTVPDYFPDHLRGILEIDPSMVVRSVDNGKQHFWTHADFAALGDGDEPVDVVFRDDDSAVVLYTSGSTDLPKGVELSNAGVISMFHMIRGSTQMDALGHNPGDRSLCVIPPNHPTAFVHTIMIPTFRGMTHVMYPLYDKRLLPMIVTHIKPQSIILTASHWAVLLASDLPDGSLSFVKKVYTGGEPVAPELQEQIDAFLRRTGVLDPRLQGGYGMSELGGMVIGNGRALKGVTVRIVDEDGQLVPDGETGLLEVKTPSRMRGYLHEPELTKQFFTADGFGKTGDMAFRDDDGIYHVIGRYSDSFETSDGQRVYLFEIENFLYHDPDVQAAEVAKIPADEIGRETPEAFAPIVYLTLRDSGREHPMETLSRIIEHCQSRFQGPAQPAAYKVEPGFPASPISGKCDIKALLKERDGYWRLAEEADRLEPVSFERV